MKILPTNHCVYDCVYCVNRISSDIPRAAFSPQEVVDLTLDFYRRNYIEGLFLSSGIFLAATCISKRSPGAAQPLIEEAGRWVDR